MSGYVGLVEYQRPRRMSKWRRTLERAALALAAAEHLHVAGPDGVWCSADCEARGALVRPMPKDAQFRRDLAAILRAAPPSPEGAAGGGERG